MSSESAEPYGDPQTRIRILEATWRLVEETGSEFTLADVASQAGVSRQALYLHFGDRSGLLVALVDHIDKSLGSEDLRAQVFGATTGAESLRRWVETMSWYSAKIDAVTKVLETAQYRDEAMAAAHRNRMDRRQGLLQAISDRIAGEGGLAEGWTQEVAAQLAYAVTMPAVWRELTRELGWTAEDYADRIWKLLERALVSRVD